MKKSEMVFLVLIGCFALAQAADYSWQEPHAKVISTGDLEWAPKPFEFKTGESVRYIDFENGKDNHSGTSKGKPWKHHPWDANAEAKSADCEGIHTYVFKRGVIYRGMLVGKGSGTAEETIRLTSDPAWGEGEASVCGSVRITDGWTRCDKKTAPGIPDPKKVWMREVPQNQVDCLWEIRDGEVIRVPIARDPNWTITDEDNPMEHWYAWSGSERVGAREVTNAAGKVQLKPNFWTILARFLP